MTVLDLDALVLKSGGHSAPSEQTSVPDACVMEAVAYVAGERWSDHPQCASPVLTSFLIGLNDRWSHDDRQLLKPFIPRLVGTRTTSADEETRRLMIVDWLVHEYAPAMFRHAGLAAEADEFESMVSITDWPAWRKVRGRIREVRDAQWKRRREAVKRAAVAVADADAVAVAVADADADADAVAVADADADADAVAVADAAAVAVAVAAAAAVAVADADADADAVAVADAAAVAVADADADADAAADAAAAAVAAAAAAAVADADAAADADADAVADAFKAKIEEATAAAVTARKNDESGYSAAYHVLRPYYEERYREVFASVGGLRESVLGLIDRLIEVGHA
jgi:hypothetical protein